MQPLKKLPDPRVYPRAADAGLAAEAGRMAALPSALQQEKFPELRDRIAGFLARGDESAVRSALALPGSAAAAALLHDALDRALAPPPGRVGVQTRLFAIPLLVVSGGNRGATISGVVPDIAEVSALFEKAGALGHARNFGFSNALTSLDALEAVSWLRLYRTANGAPDAGIGEFDLPPADIVRDSRDETVDLRFLAGAMVTPADAPSFVETGADIGRWGMGLTRALAAQLGASGVSLLPIPRPPQTFLQAARIGRFAAGELGLQLFLSNALRQARTRTGDPDVGIAAFSDATVRVHLTSVFDDLFDQTYAWPLSPLDDLDAVTGSILGLLADCQLDRIEIVDAVQDAGVRNS
jgi:hypothetical protein